MARLSGGGGVSKAVAITDTYVVTNKSDLTGLTDARKGDVGIVTSTNETYILQTEPYTTLSNWVALLSNSVIAGGANAGNIAYFNNSYTIIGNDDFNWDNVGKNIEAGNASVIGTSVLATAIFGNQNTVGYGVEDSLVSGETNNLQAGSIGCVVGGHSNAVNGNFLYVFGQLITSVAGTHHIVAGEGHVVSTTHNAVFGKSNVVSNAKNLVAGEANTLTGAKNLVAGSGNVVSASNSAVFGLSQIVAGNYNLVAGYNQFTVGVNGDKNLAVITGTGRVTGNSNAMVGEMAIIGNYNAAFGNGSGINGNNNIIGGGPYSLTGDYNAVFGDGNSQNLGTNYSIIAGYSHQVSADYVSVFGQAHNLNSNSGWSLVGGHTNVLTNADMAFVFGQNHTATAGYSVILGGQYNEVSAGYSVAMGFRARGRLHGQVTQATGAYNGGHNDQQTSVLTGGVSTTNNTPTEIYLDVDYGVHRLATQDNRAYLFKVKVVARNSAAQETAGYDLEFVFDRGATAATSRVSGITKNVIHEDIAGWDVGVTADTTNGRPNISVTGENSKTIYWYARIEMTEV